MKINEGYGFFLQQRREQQQALPNPRLKLTFSAMRPASDTLAAFFACLLARRWEDAASLVDGRAGCAGAQAVLRAGRGAGRSSRSTVVL